MNLNPLDLRGPEFLLFYVILIAVTALAVWVIRWQIECGNEGDEIAAGGQLSKDPYQMAYLRGGRNEVIQVAILSLIERRLLKAKIAELVVWDPHAADKVRRPLDKAIVMAVASDGNTRALFRDPLVLDEADLVAEPLKSLGLVADEHQWATRIALLVIAVSFLWLISGAKIAVAISRGHWNIEILIILTILVARWSWLT